MLIGIVSTYSHEHTMQQVRFWVNEEQFKEAINKLGDKSKLYGFAKKAFLKALEELKDVNKN